MQLSCYVTMQMRFMHRISVGPAKVKKNDLEITSVYMMSSMDSLEIFLILFKNNI